MISHHLNIHIKTKIPKMTNATQLGSLESNKFFASFSRRKFGITELDVKLETFLVLIHSSELLINMKNVIITFFSHVRSM